MFGNGFPSHWTTLKKLIWYQLQSAASFIIKIITGTPPFLLRFAVDHGLIKLKQYGKCDVVPTTVNESVTQYGKTEYEPSEFYDAITQYGKLVPILTTVNTAITQSGKIEQPPVDYLATVTQSGAMEQRNLPHGYTELEYARSGGDAYLDLGYKGNGNTKVEVKFKYYTSSGTTGSGRIFGSRATAQSLAFAIGTSSGTIASTETNKLFWCYDNQPFFVDNGEFGLDVWKTVVFSATEHTIDGVSTGDDYEIVEFETPQNLKLFGFDQTSGGMGVGHVDIAYCKLWDNGVLVRNLIPAKNASNVVSMFDLVSGQFLTNAGTGDFTAGPARTPSPEYPMDIWCNNGKLKVKDDELPVGYRRLKDIIFDGDVFYVTNTYLTGADTTTCTINATENARNVLGCYTGVGTGNNISFYLNVGGGGNYVRYKDALYRPQLNDGTLGQDRTLSITPTGTTGFDTDATWTQLDFTCPDPFYIGWLANATSPKFLGTMKGSITVSNRAKFIPCERESDNEIGYYDVNSSTFFTNQGTGTPTTSGYDDTHYVVKAIGTSETITDADGNTATLETLLACGSYADTQEVLAGAIGRTVGVKVLDGTENWSTQYPNAIITGATTAWGAKSGAGGYCTHLTVLEAGQPTAAGTCRFATDFNIYAYQTAFGVTSLGELKNFLAAQYAAGTPVIILYPLATPTTESVAGQTLVNAPLTVSAEVTMPSPVTTLAPVSTPDPKHPLPLVCNNGELAYGFKYRSYNVAPTLSAENYPGEAGRSVSYSDGVLICEITASAGNNNGLYPTNIFSFTAGHKYACMANAKGDTRIVLGAAQMVPSGAITGAGATTADQYTLTSSYAWYAKLWECNTNATARLNIRVVSSFEDGYASFKDILLVDLTAIFGAGNEPTTPSDIIQSTLGVYPDGTPEVLTVRGTNLVDLDAVTNGYYYTPSGTYSQATDCRLTDYIPVKAGEKYTVWAQAEALTNNANIRANLFDSSQTWMKQTSVVLNSTEQPKVLVVTPAVDGYLRVSANYQSDNRVDWSTLRVAQGEYTVATMPSYEPYVTPQTVTNITTLLAVGDYKDEAELIAGVKTGKCGVKVLTGEDIYGDITNGCFFVSIPDKKIEKSECLCSHFVYKSGASYTITFGEFGAPSASSALYFKADGVTTIAQAGAFLDDLVAAGNPVIVIYPLATETIEQTTAYPQLANGKYVNADVEAEVSDISVVFARGQSSTPTPYTPISYMCNNGELKVDSNGDIYAYGTPEVLTVANNVWAVEGLGYLDTDGDVVPMVSGFGYTDYIPVTPGQTVTASETVVDRYVSNGLRICFYASDKSFISPRLGGAAIDAGDYSFPVTAPANAAYVRVSSGLDSTKVTDICVTTETQTASVENLLAVDNNYRDAQDIISGLLTHKVGVKVLTGSADEVWTYNSSVVEMFVLDDVLSPSQLSDRSAPCTHFKTATSIPARGARDGYAVLSTAGRISIGYNAANGAVTAFKSYLAAQYAAGTPVIVFYPLATEVEESVDGQINYRKYPQSISYTAEVDSIDITPEHSTHTIPELYCPLRILCNNGIVKANNTGHDVHADGPQEVLTLHYANGSAENVTVESLFSVADYKDTQEIISGDVTRKVYFLAFDGTEPWSLGTNGVYLPTSLFDYTGLNNIGYITPVCNKFKPVNSGWTSLQNGEIDYSGSGGESDIEICWHEITDIEWWKAKLAEWYAAGDPLIVGYPRATEASYTGTPHSALVKGSAEVTQAGVSNITITTVVGSSSTPSPYAPITLRCNNGDIAVDNGGNIVVTGTLEVITLSANGHADQTASAVSLFAAGTYRDTHEIISGAVTRHVGVKVLNSGDSINMLSPGLFEVGLTNALDGFDVLSTHFQYDEGANVDNSCYISNSGSLVIKMTACQSVSDFVAYIGSQTYNGCPVVVFFPLANPQTESAATQSLETYNGDNTLTATTNVPDVYFYLEYAGNYPDDTPIVGYAVVGQMKVE